MISSTNLQEALTNHVKYVGKTCQVLQQDKNAIQPYEQAVQSVWNMRDLLLKLVEQNRCFQVPLHLSHYIIQCIQLLSRSKKFFQFQKFRNYQYDSDKLMEVVKTIINQYPFKEKLHIQEIQPGEKTLKMLLRKTFQGEWAFISPMDIKSISLLLIEQKRILDLNSAFQTFSLYRSQGKIKIRLARFNIMPFRMEPNHYSNLILQIMQNYSTKKDKVIDHKLIRGKVSVLDQLFSQQIDRCLILNLQQISSSKAGREGYKILMEELFVIFYFRERLISLLSSEQSGIIKEKSDQIYLILLKSQVYFEKVMNDWQQIGKETNIAQLKEEKYGRLRHQLIKKQACKNQQKFDHWLEVFKAICESYSPILLILQKLSA